MDIDTLSSLLDSEFRDLVEQDAFEPDTIPPEVAVALRAPANVARWRRFLVEKKSKLQVTVASLNASRSVGRITPQEYAQRHYKLVFALGRVDVRLVEAGSLTKQVRARAASARELLDRAERLLLDLAPESSAVKSWIEDRRR